MAVQFAKSYVDRLFAEKNMEFLHHLISVLESDRAIPEEFWLFCRLLEWIASSRSGVWQYYEGVPDDTLQRVNQDLERFGLAHIAEQYRFGRTAWDGPDRAASLDDWIEKHEPEINEAALNLIAPLRNHLYPL